MLKEIITTKPVDPVQYMVDYLVMDVNDAKQDKYGLSKYRRGKLTSIFNLMDKNGSGAVDYKEIKEHSAKYGGQALTEAGGSISHGRVCSRTCHVFAQTQGLTEGNTCLSSVVNDKSERVKARLWRE